MNDGDRIVLAKCFLFSIKVLFAILYAATGRVDSRLFDEYGDLAIDLKRWYSPEPPDEADADAASVTPVDYRGQGRGGVGERGE